MKQIYHLLVLMILAGIFNSCKKKTLPEAEQGNDPQFYFKGNVNGSFIQLEAGVNDYYMHSGYSQNTANGCYGFNAELKQANCNTCANSIMIEINDRKNSAINGVSGADSAFIPTCYPFFEGTPAPISYSLSFFPLFSGATATSYFWNFGDGSTSTQFNPSHIYKRPGEYNVSLTITDINSCSNSVSNVQRLGITDKTCNTTITVTSTSTLNASFSHSTIGVPPYDFLWDFGDGNFSTVASPTYTYTNQGRYAVSLRVIDAVGDTGRANFNYVTPSSTVCTTNYLVFNQNPMPNNNAWSNVVIKWTDSNGVQFSSDSLQPATSYFRIISSEDYHDNDNGQKTKKLTARFNCKLYSTSGSVMIENAEAVIVVAYK